MKRVGVDIGGTFTDLVLYDSERRALTLHKVLTTPDDLAGGVIRGVVELLEAGETQIEDLQDVTYATTVATNAVLERKGRPTALLTTRGFRDVLLVQRQARYDLFDLFIDKPSPLLRRRDIFEIGERIDAEGTTLTQLDEDEVRAVAGELASRAVESVAVCFLHGYRQPRHERRTAAILAEELPGCHVSASHEVSPLIGEYERSNTTVTDAYVKPITTTHLAKLQTGLAELGFPGQLTVMLSDGGIATVERAAASPVRLIESGPAAGAQIAAFIGAAVGTPRVIAFDMGGTTAKIALVEDGRPTLSDRLEVDRIRMIPGSGLPLSIPSVDLIEIGSGGGSIARVEGALLRVGPGSAGAVPGPVCYGGGGSEPTVTDADLVLRYLNPDYFLGGRMSLDTGAAEAAIERDVATPLGLDVRAAARGIYDVINASMEQAIRAGTVQRGRDPRDYTLVATGGAGPVHAVALARALGVPRVVVPPASGVASALGLLAAKPRATYLRSGLTPLDERFGERAATYFDELAREALEGFTAEQRESGRVVLARSVGLRYVGQGYDLSIEVPGEPGDPVDADLVVEAFHVAYERLYRRSERGEPVEATTWRLDAVIDTPVLERSSMPAAGRGARTAGAAGPGEREIWDVALGAHAEASVWRYADLEAGAVVEGPAVIEQVESTTVLFTGDRADIDDLGNIVIAVGLEDHSA
ncbi:MAG TPA: hydantoinase/oxoprolinase family protein [Thermoleophilaceae bacterium]|nr:hydantoinase/oxoprolinase family protein [Thermoleophilaceae bacterium]